MISCSSLSDYSFQASLQEFLHQKKQLERSDLKAKSLYTDTLRTDQSLCPRRNSALTQHFS